MSGKTFGLASLVAAVVGLGSVRSEGPPTVLPAPTPAAAPETVPAPAPPLPSRWMLYERQPGCCGPIGGDGPIGYELYLRSGISFPVAGGLSGTLDNGWVIEGGARTLFFDPGAEAACTIDLGVGNTYNRVGDRATKFKLFNVGPNQLAVINGITIGDHNPLVSGADLNRTYVYLAGGREWYLWGSAEHDDCTRHWRVGVDVGGLYGSEKLDLNETRHLTDTNAGIFVSGHSDLEIPWGQILVQLGVRLEYGYTWSDVLQKQNNADIQELNLLFTAGMRF